MSPGNAKTAPLEKEIADERVRLDLEEAVWCDEHLNGLMTSCLEDFPDDNDWNLPFTVSDRIIKAYIVFHKQYNTEWDPTAVTRQTPYDICAFITHKCGEKDKGYEGKRFLTAISTRAALSYWYRHCRPNESVTEWCCNKTTGVCHGLPTRAQAVSEFMIGLEKMKARSGEVSQSARALLREDMHRLNDYCMNATRMPEERRWGVVHYEVVTLEFSSVEIVPGERAYVEIRLKTHKSAQTGVLHTWRLWANDADPRLCPVRALIQIACLYGSHVPPRGPLFLRIGKFGDIMHDQPVVGATQL
ncbi:uncharacterized protein EDB91DRAFT_1255849 [Suillus paluster]|uniref:uncharacterized protein n=1 Tax=Suillus paluster TaxID=48578 RepID=UPI001B85EC1E|nr:uncharacterized protein EDB91DRAFT_1255849 [Suillus paluster]KAG1722934.1 hypothetical protein EDB91DRAFT_1255849 [Suillus paluster]